jgi:tetratricopeptide (TPR) repeat protein
LIKEKKLNKAEKLLRSIVNKKNVKFEQLNSYSNFMIGDILFKKNNYDSAIVYYNRFILSTTEKDLLGITNYRLGICYEFLGQPDVARTYFKMSDRGNQDIDDDIYAKRRGELFADREITKEETGLIRFRHFIDMGKYKTGIDSLVRLCNRTTSDEVKAEAILNISDALYSTGKYQASIDTLKMIDSLEISEETWIKPFALYYSARAENKLGNDTEALQYAEETEEYKNYDFHNKMKNLLFAIKSKDK